MLRGKAIEKQNHSAQERGSERKGGKTVPTTRAIETFLGAYCPSLCVAIPTQWQYPASCPKNGTESGRTVKKGTSVVDLCLCAECVQRAGVEPKSQHGPITSEKKEEEKKEKKKTEWEEDEKQEK